MPTEATAVMLAHDPLQAVGLFTLTAMVQVFTVTVATAVLVQPAVVPVTV